MTQLECKLAGHWEVFKGQSEFVFELNGVATIIESSNIREMRYSIVSENSQNNELIIRFGSSPTNEHYKKLLFSDNYNVVNETISLKSSTGPFSMPKTWIRRGHKIS